VTLSDRGAAALRVSLSTYNSAAVDVKHDQSISSYSHPNTPESSGALQDAGREEVDSTDFPLLPLVTVVLVMASILWRRLPVYFPNIKLIMRKPSEKVLEKARKIGFLEEVRSDRLLMQRLLQRQHIRTCTASSNDQGHAGGNSELRGKNAPEDSFSSDSNVARLNGQHVLCMVSKSPSQMACHGPGVVNVHDASIIWRCIDHLCPLPIMQGSPVHLSCCH
jgi:hypothetical protein